MAEMTKTAQERIVKSEQMTSIIEALRGAGIDVERVTDNGTLAYMISDGALEGRFITIKVVLTKEYNEEKGTGFDIVEAIQEYEMKVAAETERAEKARAKAEAKAIKDAEKRAKADKVAVAQ